MMNDIDVALHLIIEAKAEMERYRGFQHDMSVAKDWKDQNEVYKRYETIPTKALVNDNLKTARRLLKKAYM